MPKFFATRNETSEVYQLQMDNPYVRVSNIEADEVLHLLASDDSPSDQDIAITFDANNRPRAQIQMLPFCKGTRVAFKSENMTTGSRIEIWITEPVLSGSMDIQLSILENLETINRKLDIFDTTLKEWSE